MPEQEVLKMAASQGFFAVLFVGLLFYVLKTNAAREIKYQETIQENQSVIKELTNNFAIVNDIREDVKEIKKRVYD